MSSAPCRVLICFIEGDLGDEIAFPFTKRLGSHPAALPPSHALLPPSSQDQDDQEDVEGTQMAKGTFEKHNSVCVCMCESFI
jgi:hypothetical protein